MIDLKNHVALVTGSGEGIGQAIALRLSEAGAGIIVNDINIEAAKRTAEKIKQNGGNALFFQADVSKKDAVFSMVEKGERQLGTIDILVNNAGILGHSILIKDLPEELWQRVLAINLSGVFYCCQAVIPMMIKKRWGKIVNIASTAGRRMSGLGGADYTASKYGVVGFSRHLAFEMAAYGINVNVIAPGATLTPLVKSMVPEKARDEFTEQIPLGEWITPEDQANAVLFLVSNLSNMITGAVLDVNGGQLLGIATDYKENLRRRSETSKQQLKDYHELKGKNNGAK